MSTKKVCAILFVMAALLGCAYVCIMCWVVGTSGPIFQFPIQ